jgi:CHAT domain-containing protein
VRDELPHYRVIQLATHGVLDGRSPWLSSIVLAHGDQLAVSDLMGIKLNAELVILSACESGVGEMTHGEEVLGLARGLLAAGARAAIVSLWTVFDQATSSLMLEFHRQLNLGLKPAAALRASQLYLRSLDPKLATIEADRRGIPAAVVADIARARRGVRLADRGEPITDYRHPAYWAPFVLVGV